LSSQTDKHIHYSDNDWNEIVTKFNLNNNIEVVMHKQNPPADSHKKVMTPWLFRSFALTGIIAILGNVPLQSHLVASSNTNIQTFELSPKLDFIAHPSIPTPTIDAEYTNQYTQIDNTLFGSHELALPKRAIETYVGHVDTNTSGKWKTYQVKSYDNLTNIFHKLGHQSTLKTLQLNTVIKKELTSLKKGSILRASSIDGKLSELVFTHNKKDSYVITLNDGKYSGAWKKNIFEVRQSRASFNIKNGLFFDGRKAGIASNIIKQVVKVFDWDIDFSHDVRIGDEVTAVFEEIYHDGDKVGNQHLLAAEFINKGREFKAIRYTYKDGKSDYFTPQGREMKKAFIRTPISHARVSSHFNPGRFHPVLHKMRAHKGTDFAARTGTPIMVTGNGTIKSIGRKGGYGRAIVIQHREGYTTMYAHMSRFKKKLKLGSKVYQGDVIGYVGSSGLATGPHLHYEFRLNNKAIDPMRAPLPNSMSLTSSELKDFRNKAINLVLQLNVLHRFVKANIEINSAIGG
jgi:murein DD-endopeptidase MepM/ murein hydrolase activator NlpD